MDRRGVSQDSTPTASAAEAPNSSGSQCSASRARRARQRSARDALRRDYKLALQRVKELEKIIGEEIGYDRLACVGSSREVGPQAAGRRSSAGGRVSPAQPGAGGFAEDTLSQAMVKLKQDFIAVRDAQFELANHVRLRLDSREEKEAEIAKQLATIRGDMISQESSARQLGENSRRLERLAGACEDFGPRIAALEEKGRVFDGQVTTFEYLRTAVDEVRLRVNILEDKRKQADGTDDALKARVAQLALEVDKHRKGVSRDGELASSRLDALEAAMVASRKAASVAAQQAGTGSASAADEAARVARDARDRALQLEDAHQELAEQVFDLQHQLQCGGSVSEALTLDGPRPSASLRAEERRPGDWDCLRCGEMQFARRQRCRICGEPQAGRC